ncbi:MAG: SAM-dependent methyltransferase [Methyloceanibacter sp.]|nr:SAM-dependent methyltransferase [Methyloceanibacter sp.]
MSEISELARTALIVADYRARENTQEVPLYRDPIVPLFLNDDTRREADRIAADFPAEHGVRLRTRYFDDQLSIQIRNGCRQVVILGSGFDTRAIRKPAPNVRYFEIDDGAILDFKKATLAQAGVEADAVFIANDYVHRGILAPLASHGFDRSLPTYFIWEGNTMYLNRASVLRVLLELRNGLCAFAISFDYFSAAVATQTTGNRRLSSLAQRFADMGAAFTFGIDDLYALASDAGLNVADNTTIGELFRAYWPHLPADDWHDHYSLCTLESPEALKGT